MSADKAGAEVGNYKRALAQLVAADSKLAEAIQASPSFQELLHLMADRADLFDMTIQLHLQMPDLFGNLADIRKAGAKMQRYADEICRVLDGEPRKESKRHKVRRTDLERPQPSSRVM